MAPQSQNRKNDSDHNNHVLFYTVNIEAYNGNETTPYYTNNNAELYSNVEQANASARQCSLFGSSETYYIPTTAQIEKGEASATKWGEIGSHRLPQSKVRCNKVESTFDQHGCLRYTTWLYGCDRLSRKTSANSFADRRVTAYVKKIQLMDAVKPITPQIRKNKAKFLPEGLPTPEIHITPTNPSRLKTTPIPTSIVSAGQTSPADLEASLPSEKQEYPKTDNPSSDLESPYFLLIISLALVILTQFSIHKEHLPIKVVGSLHDSTSHKHSRSLNVSSHRRAAIHRTPPPNLPVETETNIHHMPPQNGSPSDAIPYRSQAKDGHDADLRSREAIISSFVGLLDKHEALLNANFNARSSQLDAQRDALQRNQKMLEAENEELKRKAQEGMVWKEKYENMVKIMVDGLGPRH
ncbi:hypothetical protein BJ508DRAFT_417807 [Ascobolus immersus RN42]|uniref:Uncharacterized protein n=1 Tax=Ascobolus immersus RN42 TaxID=1160509 RepID=A0A3N4HVJ3_ASCIM|nr:hypothetical protein BJ508DRAFT_417807 [Ascobolus immersus RN42]